MQHNLQYARISHACDFAFVLLVSTIIFLIFILMKSEALFFAANFAVSLEKLGNMIPQRVQRNMKRKKRQKRENEKKTKRNPRTLPPTLINHLQVEMKM